MRWDEQIQETTGCIKARVDKECDEQTATGMIEDPCKQEGCSNDGQDEPHDAGERTPLLIRVPAPAREARARSRAGWRGWSSQRGDHTAPAIAAAQSRASLFLPPQCQAD